MPESSKRYAEGAVSDGIPERESRLDRFFRLDDVAAAVLAAGGTSAMRQLRFTTVRADGHRRPTQSVVGAAAVAARLGVTSFWIGHLLVPLVSVLRVRF